MTVQDRWASYILAAVLSCIGIVLFVSSLLALFSSGAETFLLALLEIPGRWLFDGFHLASLFVPVYFFLTAALVAVGKGIPGRLIALNAGVVPMLLAALSLRLIWDPDALQAAVPGAVAGALTVPGGAALSGALFLLSLVGLQRLHRVLTDAGRAAAKGTRTTDRAGAPGADTAASGSDAAEAPADGSSPAAAEATAEQTAGRRWTALLASPAWARSEPEGERFDSDEEWFGDEADEERGELVGARGVRSIGDGGVRRLRAIVTNHGHRDGVSGSREEANGRRGGAEGEAGEYKRTILHRQAAEAPPPGSPEAADETRPAAAEPVEELEPANDLDDEPLSVFFSRGRFTDEESAAHGDPDEAWLSEDPTGDEFDSDGDELEDPIGFEEPEHVDGEEHAESDDRAALHPSRRAQKMPQTYSMPIRELLESYGATGYWEIDEETKQAAEVLRVTLEEFQIQAEVTGIRRGPVITMFEILPAPGVKLAKIVNLSDNIALRLAAQSVRIVAPIPGKHAVGIEIPNKRRHIVSFAELLEQEEFQDSEQEIPLALGKDIPGDAQIVDLTKTPHLLIAGATGSGKSVCVNSIICSILFRRRPDEVKMILIDPKIVELKFYNDIPHLLTPVITDPKRAFQALQYLIYEMERRYALLDSQGVRDIKSYNQKIKRRNLATEPLPYIVVVVDEFADLISTSGKELESTLARLAAMSRAVGIHLVLATQRPSTDVITGLIKANIPSRIAFMVSSKVDSRIIIDSGGAEKLLGQGDMLFTSAWDPFPFRVQGAFLSEDEVDRVVTHVKSLGEPDYIDDEIFIDDEDDNPYQQELEDPLLERGIEIVTTANKASASYLQRRLKIGYNRAARMIEEMERLGIVGPQQGSKPREIIGVGE